MTVIVSARYCGSFGGGRAVLERVAVRPVPRHAVVQARAAGLEAARACRCTRRGSAPRTRCRRCGETAAAGTCARRRSSGRRINAEFDVRRARRRPTAPRARSRSTGPDDRSVTVLIVLNRARSYLYGMYVPCHATMSSGEWSISASHSPPKNFATTRKSPSRSSNAATGAKKSRAFARPFVPIGAELGQPEVRAVVLADVAARGPSGSSTRNFTPRGTTQISPGATCEDAELRCGR